LQRRKGILSIFAMVLAAVLIFGMLPVTVLAGDEELFVSTRELVERTFPADLPHDLEESEWWRMVQLATINESVPGSNFNAPSFGSLDAMTVENVHTFGSTVVSLVAMGYDPRNAYGRDLVQEMLDIVNQNTEDVIPGDAPWAMPEIFYALTAADAIDGVEDHVIAALLNLQDENGEWYPFDRESPWSVGFNIEATAQLILMLEPFSQRTPEVAGALSQARAFILSYQMDCGGFPGGWGLGVLGLETTARVIEAIAALGESPLDWTVENDITATPVHALINEMQPDGTFYGEWTMHEQMHIALASVGLKMNPFTNLRNPVALPEILVPLSGVPPATARITVSDPYLLGVFFDGSLRLYPYETAYSLLRRTGLEVESVMNGAYVAGISGLREFDGGPQSGWMFRINGEFPGAPAIATRLLDGDHVEWLFTRDLEDTADSAVSREEAVAILWKLEGSPEFITTGQPIFADVRISPPIYWAVRYGIVEGHGGGFFNPYDEINAEQFAVLLRNYARFLGRDTDATGIVYGEMLVSPWAVEAMQWVNSFTALSPGAITRGEIYNILERFFEGNI